MTVQNYEKKMNALADELKQAANARPYDPFAYNKVVDRLNALHSSHYHRRRRRPWAALISVIVLLIILLAIVYSVLSLLYMEGIQ